jgi:hypothetical protein
MSLMRKAASLWWAAVKEIFEEAAYERFLTRTCGERSRESYRAFLCEQELCKARRPRCC